MRILPVDAEFVIVNDDKVGKSNSHCKPVEPFDRDMLEVTGNRTPCMEEYRKTVEVSDFQMDVCEELPPTLMAGETSNLA